MPLNVVVFSNKLTNKNGFLKSQAIKTPSLTQIPNTDLRTCKVQAYFYNPPNHSMIHPYPRTS